LKHALSPREEEVCRLMAEEGLSDKELVARLRIAHATLRTYLHAIFLKTGAQGRNQVIVWAYKSGLVRTDSAGVTRQKR
jgi:DNA-binding CsgD family transcriptional regulator